MATNKPTPDKDKAQAAAQNRSFLRDAFPLIKRASLIFLVCAVVGAGLVFGTQYLLDSINVDVGKAREQERQTRGMYQQAEKEKSEIHDFQSKYSQLEAQGIIGAEQRLRWIEDIQFIQNKATLEPIAYDISEQVTFTVDPSVDAENLELRGSKMHFKMNLLHEMDLINFLNGLKERQLYDLQSCTIKRQPDASPETPDAPPGPLLDADCNLYLLSIGKRSGDTDAGNALIISANSQGH